MADKKYFKITAEVEMKKDFYVEAENKEKALRQLKKLNIEKEQTVIFNGKIKVELVNKETDIVEVVEEEVHPKDIIQCIKEVMEAKGFALVSFGGGINGSAHYGFVSRETGECIWVGDENLDDDGMWNILEITEEEIRRRIEKRNKTEDFYTSEEMNKKIRNWEDEDYKAVILKIIEEKAKEYKAG